MHHTSLDAIAAVRDAGGAARRLAGAGVSVDRWSPVPARADEPSPAPRAVQIELSAPIDAVNAELSVAGEAPLVIVLSGGAPERMPSPLHRPWAVTGYERPLLRLLEDWIATAVGQPVQLAVDEAAVRVAQAQQAAKLGSAAAAEGPVALVEATGAIVLPDGAHVPITVSLTAMPGSYAGESSIPTSLSGSTAGALDRMV